MKANFYPQLTMRDDRRKIDASGPLNWDEVPAEVDRLAVVAVVTQAGVRGRGTSREYLRTDEDREWWCEAEVESGDAFGPGCASCAGARGPNAGGGRGMGGGGGGWGGGAPPPPAGRAPRGGGGSAGGGGGAWRGGGGPAPPSSSGGGARRPGPAPGSPRVCPPAIDS